ncbi:hypothetical protein JZU69_03465 [bacterium]|nr:hypothetical protein [bacterium]
MTTSKPLFVPTADVYDIQPAGVLLLRANIVYGDPSETPPAGCARAKTFVDAMLTAAHVGGYKQCDILHTLLVRNESSARIQLMARDACSAAGNAAIGKIFNEISTK